MKRDHKRELKQNELVTGFEHALGWLREHRDEARITTAVLVLLLLVGGGIVYFTQKRHRDAERAFGEALETFQAHVAGETPEGEAPAGPTYPSATEKFKKAAAAFDGVERLYPSEAAGRRARYFGALARIELGETAEAEKVLKDLAARKEANSLEPTLARVALAELYRTSGQLEKAIDALRELASDAQAPLGRDYALMALGSTLEGAKRLAEASASYKRLAEEFPESVYAAQARQRAEYLQTAVLG